MSYPLENFNNNGLIKKLLYGIFGCSILGHSWAANSSGPCLHTCGICRLAESWCKNFILIEGGADQGFEVLKCKDCGKIETIIGGNRIRKELEWAT